MDIEGADTLRIRRECKHCHGHGVDPRGYRGMWCNECNKPVSPTADFTPPYMPCGHLNVHLEWRIPAECDKCCGKGYTEHETTITDLVQYIAGALDIAKILTPSAMSAMLEDLKDLAPEESEGGSPTNLVSLSKEAIDQVFEEATHQSDYLTGLYRLAIPEWDAVVRIVGIGYPTVSYKTWDYICRKAIAFDKEHLPQVLAGGLWINSGFSRSTAVPQWKVDLSMVKLELVNKGEGE